MCRKLVPQFINIQHYYKGGPQNNTPGIPTSGQIAFSDFYGKAFVAKSRTSSSTIICGTRYGNEMASRGSVIPHFYDQIKKAIH